MKKESCTEIKKPYWRRSRQKMERRDSLNEGEKCLLHWRTNQLQFLSYSITVQRNYITAESQIFLTGGTENLRKKRELQQKFILCATEVLDIKKRRAEETMPSIMNSYPIPSHSNLLLARKR
mmetsp:Transcript_3576/g.5435  ORF Transcript_3576/g.5435 Transcript_3576/m.5435 type:complete len:122 (+) Transcript_3576:302-667(+)